jgi:hypothetical protein
MKGAAHPATAVNEMLIASHQGGGPSRKGRSQPRRCAAVKLPRRHEEGAVSRFIQQRAANAQADLQMHDLTYGFNNSGRVCQIGKPAIN